MRIAVDAKLLANPGSGIGRYTTALLSHMVAMGHQWLLYSERPFTTSLLDSPRVLARVGDAAEGSLRGLRWSQLGYQRWAVKDVADLFWSPRHHLPLFLPRDMPRVVTVHDLVWRQFPDTMPRSRLWLERALMGPSIRSADRVICVSRFTASEVSRYYPSAIGKCQVIHEAAEPNVSVDRRSREMPARYNLFVGTLEPRKNLPRLLRAYALLKDDSQVPHLVLVGGKGWGGEDLPGLVNRLGLQDRVSMPGHVAESELQSLYAGAESLIMPSLYEGFGLPVLEAMQHGVPAIVSSTSSLPEVAGDGGLLVNPYSERELAAAIQRMAHEPELRDELAARAALRASRFSWQRAAEETLALFEATLAAHEPRAYRHRYLDELAN